jgi:hypothetical protein
MHPRAFYQIVTQPSTGLCRVFAEPAGISQVQEMALHHGCWLVSLRRAFDLAGGFRAGLIPQVQGPNTGLPFCGHGLVAQSVEQRPFKPLVLGSSPSQPTTSSHAIPVPG